MNTVQRVIRTSSRWLAQVTATAFTAMRHPRAGIGWFLLNRTSINYAASVIPDANSIILACVGWVQRTFSEAPPVLEQWAVDRQEWAQHLRDEFLDLLEHPNPYYNGTTLWKATVADRMISGTAYWIKVRSKSGRVVQLWWAPSEMMEPVADPGDPTSFINHYEYKPGGDTVMLRVEDVVRFPDGLDPSNPRKGFSRMKALYREIFTDDEAANMTASLLRNMGVPGVIISPENGSLGKDTAEGIKQNFMAKFSGDRKGEPLVMEGATKIQQFGFSPEQMQLRALRGIPEERITAVLGVNAAVVGLGAGLSTTKVGATLREYREEAFESTIIPMYREMASELTHQLLADFRPIPEWRLVFDLSKVRVLQDDENKRAERLNAMLAAGGITVAEYRRHLGFIALPEHEMYLRQSNAVPVPAGLSPEEQAEQSKPAPAQPPRSPSATLVRLNAALVNRLLEPGVDVPAALGAYSRMVEEIEKAKGAAGV